MAIPADYRTLPLSVSSIADCARFTGERPYWRLYVTENVLRVIVHSVLTEQYGQNWWSFAVGKKADETVQGRKAEYLAQPQHSFPGPHDIYFLLLSDLARIMLEQSQHFLRRVPDIDAWISRIESVRLPRNVVGHMNWLNASDIQEIDQLYIDIRKLERRLARSRFNLLIPS